MDRFYSTCGRIVKMNISMLATHPDKAIIILCKAPYHIIFIRIGKRNIFFKIPFAVVNRNAAAPGAGNNIAVGSLYAIHNFIFRNRRRIVFLVLNGLKILAVRTKNIDAFIGTYPHIFFPVLEDAINFIIIMQPQFIVLLIKCRGKRILFGIVKQQAPVGSAYPYLLVIIFKKTIHHQHSFLLVHFICGCSCHTR